MKAIRNRSISVLAAMTVVAVGCMAFVIGFILVPSTLSPATVWENICRAAGSPISSGQTLPGVAAPGFTRVVFSAAAMAHGTPQQIGHGATLALRCTACHGASGMSGANAPNLAGQYSEVIYKQLVDFKLGARIDAVMGAMVATLSDEEMLDLAHYYAYLPRPTSDAALARAPALVRVGEPMRNIAPCASCHGAKDGKVGAPALESEPESYIRAQLTAFSSGARKNDANAIMRGEARLLTTAEIESLTRYYAGPSP